MRMSCRCWEAEKSAVKMKFQQRSKYFSNSQAKLMSCFLVRVEVTVTKHSQGCNQKIALAFIFLGHGWGMTWSMDDGSPEWDELM